MGSANVFFHLKNNIPGEDCFLNDLDYNMVCLMEAIRDNLVNFKTEYIKYEFTEKTFYDALERYRLNAEEKYKLSPLVCALDIFYLLHFSYHANKKDFIPYEPSDTTGERFKNIQRDHFVLPLLPLYKIHCRLENVNISCKDALDFIDNHLSGKNTLFYIDSPYFYSEEVYEVCKSGTDSLSEKPFPHEELAQKLIDINNSGNYFVASNRVTVSSTNKKNSRKLSNKLAIEMANKCYSNHGFNYKLIACKNQNDEDKNQVEILVSNYPFKDSKTCIEITEAEVNACIASKMTKSP